MSSVSVGEQQDELRLIPSLSPEPGHPQGSIDCLHRRRSGDSHPQALQFGPSLNFLALLYFLGVSIALVKVMLYYTSTFL